MSDPSAINLPIHQALTSDMLLGLKPSAPKSRSYRISIPPINKNVFVGGDQMIFELSTGKKGTWLDQSQSYLKFSVQVESNAAATVNLENSAYGFLQRFDLYNSSNLLETINEYGQLCNFLMDTSLTQSDKAGLSSLIGTNPTTLLAVPAIAVAGVGAGSAVPAIAIATAPITPLQTAGDRSGMTLTTVATVAGGGGGISTAIPYTFCLPLLSGVVGINSSKMLPVGKLHSPIRMEMYLSSNDDALYYGYAAAGTKWQLVNVEFCACYVELQDDSLENLTPPGEQEYISTVSYRQSSSMLPMGSTGEFTTLLPFRAASITALYARFRNVVSGKQGVTASACYRKSSSVNPNLSYYYFRISSSLFPNKPVYLNNGSLVGSGSEGYAELLKSFHAISSTIGNTALTYPSYNVASTPTAGWGPAYVPVLKTGYTAIDTHGNAFAIGLECQSFSNRNDTILSGISTLNSQIYFTGGIVSGLAAGGVIGTLLYDFTVDFFSQMDMILVIQDGIMSAKY